MGLTSVAPSLRRRGVVASIPVGMRLPFSACRPDWLHGCPSCKSSTCNMKYLIRFYTPVPTYIDLHTYNERPRHIPTHPHTHTRCPLLTAPTRQSISCVAEPALTPMAGCVICNSSDIIAEYVCTPYAMTSTYFLDEIAVFVAACWSSERVMDG